MSKKYWKGRQLQFVNWFPKWQGIHLFIVDKSYVHNWYFYFIFWEVSGYGGSKLP